MAYEKTIWVNGQAPAIDADHLNKIEQGIADAVSVTPQSLSDTQEAQARTNINAAPGGYGLGDNATLISADTDLNSITKNGWYQFLAPPIHAPTGNQDGWNSGYSALLVNSRNGEVVTQTIFCSNMASVYGCQIKRVFVDGKWYPWEWLNPPMELGVEYRTTERFLGKPVYAYIKKFGACASGASVFDAIVNVNPQHIISVYGSADDMVLPLIYGVPGSADAVNYSINLMASASATTNIALSIFCGAKRSFSSAYVCVKYTKTTD